MVSAHKNLSRWMVKSVVGTKKTEIRHRMWESPMLGKGGNTQRNETCESGKADNLRHTKSSKMWSENKTDLLTKFSVSLSKQWASWNPEVSLEQVKDELFHLVESCRIPSWRREAVVGITTQLLEDTLNCHNTALWCRLSMYYFSPFTHIFPDHFILAPFSKQSIQNLSI